MKFRGIKGFVAGVVTTILLFATVFTVFADPVGKQIMAYYNNIKLYIDGKLIEPKDANGNAVEPFIYEGTTYLPVRAVGQAFGKEVSFDKDTYSVYIGKKNDGTDTADSWETNTELEEMTVENAQQLYDAIGPNRKIMLKPGKYDLSGIVDVNKYSELSKYKAKDSMGQINVKDVKKPGD